LLKASISCTQKRVVHGDLKTSNVLIDSSLSPVLCDFGRSKVIEERGYTTRFVAGSARYMAPELLPQSEDSDGDDGGENGTPPPPLTAEADVYSYSMVSLEVLSGKSPFYGHVHDLAIPLLVMNGKRPKFHRYRCSALTQRVQVLLAECWHHDTSQRPGMSEVVGHLLTIQRTPLR